MTSDTGVLNQASSFQHPAGSVCLRACQRVALIRLIGFHIPHLMGVKWNVRNYTVSIKIRLEIVVLKQNVEKSHNVTAAARNLLGSRAGGRDWARSSGFPFVVDKSLSDQISIEWDVTFEKVTVKTHIFKQIKTHLLVVLDVFIQPFKLSNLEGKNADE